MPKKQLNKRDIKGLLDSFISKNQGDVMRFLDKVNNDISNDISYSQIKNAWQTGDIDAYAIDEITDKQSKLLNAKMAPAWEKGVRTGAGWLGRDLGFELPVLNTKQWIEKRSTELITRITDDQREAINRLIKYHAITDNSMDIPTFGRKLRGCIGLTSDQISSLLKKRDELYAYYMKKGYKGDKLNNIVNDQIFDTFKKYHKYRGYRIAQTELAMSTNYGMNEAVKQWDRDNKFKNKIIKRFYTSLDERVCKICNAMHNKKRELYKGKFEGIKHHAYGKYLEHPPLHPFCRCVILYEEV